MVCLRMGFPVRCLIFRDALMRVLVAGDLRGIPAFELAQFRNQTVCVVTDSVRQTQG
jgi:hypothetical protein